MMKKILITTLCALSIAISSPLHSVYAQDASDPVNVEGDENNILGDFSLHIIKPFGTLEGEDTIFSWIAFIYYLISIFVLIAFLVVEIIGGIKLAASQLKPDKLPEALSWIKNGFIGLVALFLTFGVVNVIALFLGLGPVLELAQTLRSCGGVFGYEYINDNPALFESGGQLTCTGGGWTVGT